MSFRRSSSLLGGALTAAHVIRLLHAYKYDDKLPNKSEEAIEAISDARIVIRYLNGMEREQGIFCPRTKNFSDYDAMTMMRDIVKQMEWTTWNEDLEQWLANIDIVMEFFEKIQSAGQARSRYERGGCF